MGNTTYEELDLALAEFLACKAFKNQQMHQIRHTLEEGLRQFITTENIEIEVEDLLLYSKPSDVFYRTTISPYYTKLGKVFKSEELFNQLVDTGQLEEYRNLLQKGLQTVTQETEDQYKFELAKKKNEEEIVIPVDPDSIIDPATIKSAVTAILNILRNVYEPCFIEKPYGVFSAGKIWYLDENHEVRVREEGTIQLKTLYGILDEQLKGELPEELPPETFSSEYFQADGSLAFFTNPIFHLKNMHGLHDDGTISKSWKEFEPYLRKKLTDLIGMLFINGKDNFQQVQSSVYAVMTNVIYFTKFELISSLRMKMRWRKSKVRLDKLFNTQAEYVFGTDLGRVVSYIEDKETGISSIFYVFNADAYKKEILFAYKSYSAFKEAGILPTARSIILGVDMDGEPVTEDFENAANLSFGILAGSRSGKGVLTLNILASMFASNHPVMYLDAKPDMAVMLWEMERYFTNKGIPAKIFAIDSLENFKIRGDSRVDPPRSYDFGLNAPKYLSNVLATDQLAVIPYLKSMQLFVLISQLRSSGVLPKEDKFFMVLDEALKVHGKYAGMLPKLDAEIKAQAPKTTKSATTGNPVIHEHLTKLRYVIDGDLQEGVKAFRYTTGGQGRTGLLILGQNIDPYEWKIPGTGSWSNSLFANIIANLNVKLIGREVGNSPSYGLPEVEYRGHEYKNERGYFAKYRGSKTPKRVESIKVFKSYLVLNDNDFDIDAYENGTLSNETYTGSLVEDVVDKATQQRIVYQDYLNPDRTNREMIGFMGLMKFIMGEYGEEELAKRMSKGYYIIEEVLTHAGILNHYQDVEHYLFDCSRNSLFTLSELRDLYAGTLTIEETLQLDKREDDEGVQGGGNVDLFAALENQPPQTPSPTFPPVNPPPKPEDTPLVDNLLEDEGVEYDTPLEEDTIPEIEPPPPPNPSRTQQQQQPPQRRQQPPIQPDRKVTQPINQDFGNREVYRPTMQLEVNPFAVTRAGKNRPLSALAAIRILSDEILKEMKKMFGDLRRVHSIEVDANGLLLNDIAFRPEFDSSLIDSLPFDIQNQVRSGNIVELFHFEQLYAFKELRTLRMNDVKLAEFRLRRELGMNPKASWLKVYSKLKNLDELYIGSRLIAEESDDEAYREHDKKGVDFVETLSEKLKISSPFAKGTVLGSVWRSRPVKVVTGAVGWTAGIKAVTVAATLFGSWGLIFGAIAGYGAYNELKNNKSSSNRDRDLVDRSYDTDDTTTVGKRSSKKKKKK